jgi:hypothetical protein
MADAWGSLITPLGTFPSVLRLQVVTLQHSWYRFEAGEPWTYTGEFVTISYQWYAPDIKVPLMNIQQEVFARSDLSEAAPEHAFIPSNHNFFGIQKEQRLKGGLNIVQYLADYDFTTGIDELPENGFMVYPNPAKNSFHIEGYNGSKADVVVIYDSSGKEVFRRATENQTIEGLTLSPGLYVVEIRSGLESMRTKLIIE